MRVFLSNQKILLLSVLALSFVAVFSSAPAFARKISAKHQIKINKVDFSDFKKLNLEQKINEVTQMDDVVTNCEIKNMKPVLIDNINPNLSLDKTKQSAMLYNTWLLQNLIDCAPENTAIYLPSGVFYFVSGNILKTRGGAGGFERHVIKPKSHVSIIGQGIDEKNKSKLTILKPFSQTSEFTDNKIYKKHGGEGTVKGGLDMFFFNDYAGTNYKTVKWLENSNFYDFIIDSEHTKGVIYNSSGKGFMINFFKNCTWDNVVVRNTDGTGFGVDIPINGLIKNSLAENCGKGSSNDGEGASGFGIGTGYSSQESMVIENSVSKRNKKFGFFYEHQGRFLPQYYRSTGNRKNSFVVKNSFAYGNLYNYGGLRANDIFYYNSKSEKSERTIADVYFSDESRNIYASIQGKGLRRLIDTKENSYYSDAVEWAVGSGVSHGITRGSFGIGAKISRANSAVLIWRFKNRQGKVVSIDNNNIDPKRVKYTSIKTCFRDVPEDASYAEAVKWNYENKVILGKESCTPNKPGRFSPNDDITRAEFITMLWRLQGSPTVEKQEDFSDVKETDYFYKASQWASAVNITQGIGKNRFAPNLPCTRDQAVTFLYRLHNLKK